LVEHPWLDHDEMLGLIATMDVGMQVSLSETFNIMAADFVYSQVPIVASTEIPWASNICTADAADSGDIADKIKRAVTWSGFNVQRNRANLAAYCKDSRRWWLRELGMVNG